MTDNDIIAAMRECKGNLYAVMKKLIPPWEGICLGSVPRVRACADRIDEAVRLFG